MGKKWGESRPAEKIVSLFTLLLYSGRKWSLKELTLQLNCSKSSILRMIDQLEGARYGKILKSKEGRESFYEMDRPSGLPRISLDAEGLDQLAMCRDFIWHLLPESIRKNLEATLAQAAVFASKVNESAADLEPFSAGRPQVKGGIDYTPFQEIYHSLIRAIRQKKICAVGYQPTLLGPIQTFDYAPKRLNAYHETIRISGWIVDENNQPRYESQTTLSLHRLKSITITARDGKLLPSPIEPDNEAFGLMAGEPFRVTVKFGEKAALYVAERQWSGEQEVRIHDDGSITLEFLAKSRPEIVKWILSFGREAEVLSPEWLGQTVQAEIAAMAHVYEGN